MMDMIIFPDQHEIDANRKDLDDRFGPNTFASVSHARHSVG